jgi:hypothetical protein
MGGGNMQGIPMSPALASLAVKLREFVMDEEF